LHIIPSGPEANKRRSFDAGILGLWIKTGTEKRINVAGLSANALTKGP
jgi:hypothetical protein